MENERYYFRASVIEPSQCTIFEFFGSFGGAEMLLEIEKELSEEVQSLEGTLVALPDGTTEAMCVAWHEPGEMDDSVIPPRVAIPAHWMVEVLHPIRNIADDERDEREAAEAYRAGEN